MQGERVTTTNSDDIVKASSVHDLLRDAARHFWRNLGASSQAQAYLGARGIQPATARRYGLGFAQPAWRDLGEVLQRYDDATALASGLLVCGGGGVHAPKAHRFDRFRNRLLFPIRDLAGKVVGFGGRFLGDEGGPKGAHAKYLNSPESEVFRKRELLYGLYEAQQAILESGEAVVVEGYVDVLSAQQAWGRGAVG
jgi:DNA primase